MEAVQQKVFIPANKQVLLSANGDPLNPNNRVASYPSAGTVSHLLETAPHVETSCVSSCFVEVPPTGYLDIFRHFPTLVNGRKMSDNVG